jgi:Transcriptional regulator, AbiEi antitoxin
MPRPTASPLQRALALAATQHGLLAAAQCRELGISRNTVQRLIARGTVSRVAPGVYRVVGTPRTWEGRRWLRSSPPAPVPWCRTAAPPTSGASGGSRRPGASMSRCRATHGRDGGRG